MTRLVLAFAAIFLATVFLLEGAYQLGRASLLVHQVPCSDPGKVHSVSPRFVVQPPPYNASPLKDVNSPYRVGQRRA